MNIRFHSYTHVGGRPNNEDSYYAGQNGDLCLFVVADGLGGHDSGEVASAIAANELKDRFLREGCRFQIEEAILAANEKILETQRETGLNMKTTVTAVFVNGETTVVANVGDSRSYAFRGREIAFQSVDHSAAQMAVNVGEITPAEIRGHEDRNILTRALGASANVKIDLFELPASSYDSLLLCSDGFWEYVLEDEMIDTKEKAPYPSDWLNRMRNLLRKRVPEGHDNNTAIVVMC